MLVGRNFEANQLSDFLTDASKGISQVVVVAGVAGIGKTALLNEFGSTARERGFVVYPLVGDPSQMSSPFGALRHLLGDLPCQATHHLLGRLDSESDSLESSVPIATVALGLLSALTYHSVDRPVLLVVDDAQWIDPSSGATLRFVARRLLADRVMIAFGLRTSDEVSPLDDESPWRDLTVLELSLLSPEQSLEALFVLGCSESDSRRFSARAGGLPLAIRELATQLQHGIVEPVLSFPEHYADVLEALASDVRRALEIAALEPDVRVIATVLGTDAGLLLEQVESTVLERIRGDRVFFRHPLIRATVLQRMTREERAAHHRSIAAALDPAHDVDRIAQHVGAVAVVGDNDAARLMAAFARRAQRRSAHAEASDAWQRASEISTEIEESSSFLLESGRTLYFSGDAASGIRIAEEVLARKTSSAVRAEAVMLLANASMWQLNPQTSLRRIYELVAEMEGDEPICSAWGLIAASNMGFLADLPPGLANARKAEALALGAQDPIASLAASGTLGWNLFLSGQMEEANERNAVIDPIIEFLVDQEKVEGASFGQIRVMRLVMEEKYEQADELLNRLIPLANRIGADLSVASLNVVLGALRWRQGRWDEAQLFTNHFVDAKNLPALSLAWVSGSAALVEASLGNEETAEQLVDRVLVMPEVQGSPFLRAWATAALGHLRLSQGRLEEAFENLQEVRVLVASMGLVQPGFFLWWGDYLDVLLQLKRHDEAREVLELLTPLATHVSSRWLSGVLQRTRGALASDPNQAELHFLSAIDAFTIIGMPFEVGRTHLTRASLIRKYNVGNGELADGEARRIFRWLGAKLWEHRSHEHHVTTTAEPSSNRELVRPAQLLSTAEYRVALAITSGRATEQIASDLFVSVRTIDFHLSSAYKKLGVRNRTGLIGLMSSERHL